MNALLAPESCPFCGAGIMLRGSGTTFLCESWKHRNGEMDQSRECLNRQRDQLLDRIKRLEEALGLVLKMRNDWLENQENGYAGAYYAFVKGNDSEWDEIIKAKEAKL